MPSPGADLPDSAVDCLPVAAPPGSAGKEGRAASPAIAPPASGWTTGHRTSMLLAPMAPGRKCGQEPPPWTDAADGMRWQASGRQAGTCLRRAFRENRTGGFES